MKMTPVLLEFPKSHFLITRKGKVNGILFKSAYDDRAPFGVYSKLTALDVPGERVFPPRLISRRRLHWP